MMGKLAAPLAAAVLLFACGKTEAPPPAPSSVDSEMIVLKVDGMT